MTFWEMWSQNSSHAPLKYPDLHVFMECHLSVWTMSFLLLQDLPLKKHKHAVHIFILFLVSILFSSTEVKRNEHGGNTYMLRMHGFKS